MKKFFLLILLVVCALASSLSTNNINLNISNEDDVNGSVEPVPNGSNLVLSQPSMFSQGYGLHIPNGLSAAQYWFSGNGTYKSYTCLRNVYAYYTFGSSNQQPSGSSDEQSQLIAFANGQQGTSVPDANNHTLFQLQYTSDVESCTTDTTNVTGRSFHEHNGKGEGGESKGTPFTEFWFDDNWLSRYATQAYGAPPPDGLWDPTNFTRWRILGGDTTDWYLYPNDGCCIDLLCLNGLYLLAEGKTDDAFDKWQQAINLACDNCWNGDEQRYVYTCTDMYYLGLLRILAMKLLPFYDGQQNDGELLQHQVSLRSNLLTLQQIEGPNSIPIGWLSSIQDTNSLINTESLAASLLGLGAGSVINMDARDPSLAHIKGEMIVQPSAFFRPDQFVTSAVLGSSVPNANMLSGPYHFSLTDDAGISSGSFVLEVLFRSPAAKVATPAAQINIYTPSANNVTSNMVWSGQNSNLWKVWKVPFVFKGDNSENTIEIDIMWTGEVNMDVAFISIVESS